MRVSLWLVLLVLLVSTGSASVEIGIDEDYARSDVLRYVISFSEANISSVSYMLDGNDGMIAEGRLALEEVERGEVALEPVPYVGGDAFALELRVSYANGSTATLFDRFVAPVDPPATASSVSWWFAPVLFSLVLVPIIAIWIHHVVAKRRLERQRALERSFVSQPGPLAPSFGEGRIQASARVSGSEPSRSTRTSRPSMGSLGRVEEDRQEFRKDFDDAFS